MRRNRPLSLILAAAYAASFFAGCSQAPAPVDTRKAAEGALNATSEEFAKAVDAKDLDKIVGYYTDDAVLFVPSGPAAVGKDAVRKAWQGFLAGPPSRIEVSGTIIDVAASDELAFERGSYSNTITDAKGKTTVMTGKLVDVWKKQADGSWKIAADTNASDK
jgi:uncharacterized protein (TIGR02246 family)